MEVMWRCDSFRFGLHISYCLPFPDALDMLCGGDRCVFTCIRSLQVELRPGVPWSVAVTVKAYSALSAHLRGEAVRSSALVGFRENRSALGP